MSRGTWKNFEIILLFRGVGGGSQFPGLEVPQRKDIKHVKIQVFAFNYKYRNFGSYPIITCT